MLTEEHEAIRSNVIDKYAHTKFALWELSREIYGYAYAHYLLPDELEDDDIVITTNQSIAAEVGVGRLTLVTSNPREVIWLFARLREAFADLINGPAKLKFYSRVAETIRIRETPIDREHKLNGMLRAAMLQAFLILDEMQKTIFLMPPDNQPTSIVKAGTTTPTDVCVPYAASKGIDATA